MHPHADPQVIVLWARHLHSKAIEDDTYYGDSCEVSDRGRLQLVHLSKAIEDFGPDIILSSPATRASTIVLESTLHDVGIPKIFPEATEWPRATEMLGRRNSEPEVEAYHESRIKRFGPGELVLPGEESFEETLHLMGAISETLILRGTAAQHALELKGIKRAARIVVLSHGNRGRQFLSWIKARGIPEKFVTEFRDFYDFAGVDPATFMPPFWYGKFFRQRAVGWNIDLGFSFHLPKDLRDSEI